MPGTRERLSPPSLLRASGRRRSSPPPHSAGSGRPRAAPRRRHLYCGRPHKFLSLAALHGSRGGGGRRGRAPAGLPLRGGGGKRERERERPPAGAEGRGGPRSGRRVPPAREGPPSLGSHRLISAGRPRGLPRLGAVGSNRDSPSRLQASVRGERWEGSSSAPRPPQVSASQGARPLVPARRAAPT